MSLHLTAADMARCEAVARILLSPLSLASVDDWRREVNRSLRLLLGADVVLFGLPSAGPYFFSEEGAPDLLERINQAIAPALGGELRSTDPDVDDWLASRREQGRGALPAEATEARTPPSLRESAFYREVLEPAGLRRVEGFSAASARGEALILIGYEEVDANPFGEAIELLLRALQPAFKAGVEALARLDAQRATLDTLSEPLLVVTLDGEELHQNQALVDFLERDANRDDVRCELHRTHRALAALAHQQRKLAWRPALPPALREVQTEAARYRFRGTLLAPGVLGDQEAILVTVERIAAFTPVLPPPETLRTRFGLTPREAEVALLVASGLSNEEIAGRLFVSPHTVRHHTENLFGKIGLNSRKGLALKLMTAGV